MTLTRMLATTAVALAVGLSGAPAIAKTHDNGLGKGSNAAGGREPQKGQNLASGSDGIRVNEVVDDLVNEGLQGDASSGGKRSGGGGGEEASND